MWMESGRSNLNFSAICVQEELVKSGVREDSSPASCHTVEARKIPAGINKGSMRTVSYGEERPICTDSNESCWAQNRRADLEFE